MHLSAEVFMSRASDLVIMLLFFLPVLFCFSFLLHVCVCVCEEKQPKATRKNGLNLPEVDKKGVAKSSMSGPELHESEILAAQGTAVWDTLGKYP